MSSSDGKINYAHQVGIDSVGAAAAFAVVYAFLLPYYIFRAVRNPTYVLIILSLFCAIRVTAFVMRATLAGSEGAGDDLNLVIGETIVYSVGFFGLLYSVYTLVLDREILCGIKLRTPMARLSGNRHIIRLALMAAVVIGIVGATNSTSSKASDISLAKTLKQVSAIIFLAVTGILAVHTMFLVLHGGADPGRGTRGAPLGATHGMKILCLIILLLLVREIFLTITVNKVQHEGIWYPLAALPEVISVFLFIVPGLVPDKQEMIASQNQYAKNPEATELA